MSRLYKYLTRATITGRLLHAPVDWLVPHNAVLPIVSGELRGRPWYVKSGQLSQWLGIYERSKVRLVRSYIKPGMRVFDIGANVGYYTLLFSDWVGETGSVVAFEPSPQNAARLIQNCRLINTRNVTVCSAAVAASVGLTPFAVDGHDSEFSIVTPDVSILHAPVVSLDKYVSLGSSSIPNVVKVDVEGFAAGVLLGAQSILQQRDSVWFVALHHAEEADACFQTFAQYGYRVYSMIQKLSLDERTVRQVDEIVAVAQP